MKAELTDHFGRQFRTLDSLFGAVTDEAWSCPDPNLKGIWQWMLHTLQTIEYYMGDKPSSEFDWRARFDVDWEQTGVESPPSREAMRAYLEDVKNATTQALEEMSEEDFAAPLHVHKHTGANFGAKMLYLMRHTQQHIGDMNRVLAANGCKAMRWY